MHQCRRGWKRTWPPPAPRSTAQRGTDGLCRIARITIYEKDTLVPVLPGTRLAVDPADLAGYRPSARFLAWYLNRKGYTVSDHHPGDDQPDAVAGQYRTEHTWLHHSFPWHPGRPSKGTALMSRLALVTGATSGIGKAFAQRLAADGYDLIVVGRNTDRLEEVAAAHTGVKVRTVATDLSTDIGVDTVAEICAAEPLTMLVNNAGVAHYMPLAQLPADKARELLHVKVVAPTMLTRAAVAGMQERGDGQIINVAGMIAFSGPADKSVMPRRAVYAGSLAHLVAMSQTLSAELEDTGVQVQVLCPGVVATEFHTRQGLDLSAVPRMSAEDVVTAGLRGLELGEVVCAPGVEDAGLLDAVFKADLAAFGGQSPELASRYRGR
ncbi:SDR family NAD(P)-dependent oxidoreductase [Streptomyces chartreusis]|uniref:SDR family NAD(P)-dependent oxidoreductase n=1 Tax=Streptomyces chartreusis TaxID=1969 RepID=UPI0033BFAE9E